VKLFSALCAFACASVNAAYEPGTVRALRSPGEIVIELARGLHTVRFPLKTNPSCAERRLVAMASELLPVGSAVKLHRGADRPRLYFDLVSEMVEWTELALAAGLARLGPTHDEALRQAEAAAREAKMGLWAGCSAEDVFDRVSREKKVSRRLLYAIALAESAHRGRPWPWTLNVEGRSAYFATREAAHAALIGYLHRGHRSIDVGYMQVNLAFNGARFPNTWAALDPYQNLAAAADILRENYAQVRDVARAVGHYHSRTPWRANRYFKRVANHYSVLNSRETD